MLESIIKRIFLIISIFSIGINIALLTFEPNTDRLILDIAEHSYFIGCTSNSKDFNLCKTLSEHYRKDFSEHTGLEDSTK